MGERPSVDVLIPTYRRAAALAVTLAGLANQTLRPFRVIVSDQTEEPPLPSDAPEVLAIVRVLEATGRWVERHRHLPRRGMAEHRQWLLDQATAPYALYLDDDVFLERDMLDRLVRAVDRTGAGFVGAGLVGLSHVDDVRPDEQAVEFWEERVVPERVRPGSEAWLRHRLHNAANLEHLRRRLAPEEDRLYKVAWVGGCVMYDVSKLREAGGFDFWRRLPPRHAGEDVLAQLRVMARHGGAGLFPSGAYHLEVPTTIPPHEREVDAPKAIPTVPLRATPRSRLARRAGPRRRRRRTQLVRARASAIA